MTVPESEEVRAEREQRAPFDELDSKFGPRYYDVDGNPVSMWDWVMSREMMEERHIGDTYIRHRGHTYRVSTVHLGLDHSFSPYPHRPIIFETMVFEDEDMGGFDGICERYATKEQAARGHKAMVRYVKWAVANQPKAKQLISNGSKP